MRIIPKGDDTRGILRVTGLTALAAACIITGHQLSYKGVHPSRISPVNVNHDTPEAVSDPCGCSYQQAIEAVHTPQQAQQYLWTCMRQKIPSTHETFSENHSDGEGECWDYASSAAALLKDDGYPPYILAMKEWGEKVGHAVYLYRDDEGFRALGNSPVREPCGSVDEVVERVNDQLGSSFDTYYVVDMAASYPDGRWIDDVDSTPPLRLFPPDVFQHELSD